MTPAFVLGNGTSRLGLDLEALRQHGKIYGCNGLYRDFTPDVLVATDPGISSEIEDADYPSRGTFYTRNPRHDASLPIPMNYGFSSGPIAATLAARDMHNPVYLIGFDLTGVDGHFNNVYADTPHYKLSSQEPTFYGNWVNQIIKVSQQFDNTTFIRVGPEDQYRPPAWNRHNIKFMTIAEFCASINTVSWMNSKKSTANTQSKLPTS